LRLERQCIVRVTLDESLKSLARNNRTSPGQQGLVYILFFSTKSCYMCATGLLGCGDVSTPNPSAYVKQEVQQGTFTCICSTKTRLPTFERDRVWNAEIARRVTKTRGDINQSPENNKTGHTLWLHKTGTNQSPEDNNRNGHNLWLHKNTHKVIRIAKSRIMTSHGGIVLKNELPPARM